jgi:hypothetical protein
MAGLLLLGAICNYMISAVEPRFHEPTAAPAE